MRHEKEFIFRPISRTSNGGRYRVLGAAAQVGLWASGELRAPRNHQRGVLSDPSSCPWRALPHEPAAVSNCVSLLPPFGSRMARGKAFTMRCGSGCASRPDTSRGRAPRFSTARLSKEPNKAGRKATTREKKGRRTQAACRGGHARFVVGARHHAGLAAKIVTAENSRCSASTSGSSSPNLIGPTAPIAPPQFGLGAMGLVRRIGTPNRAAGLKFYPNAGL